MGRQISECLPAELVSRIEEVKLKLGAGSGAATKALRPGPHDRRDETAAVFEKATTKTLREGKPWPSMLREEGAATAIGMGKVATTEAAAELGGQVDTMKKPTRQQPRVLRLDRAFREMTTVNTAATEGMPRPSAVVISLSAWKAAHHSLNRKMAAHDRMTSAAAPPKSR